MYLNDWENVDAGDCIIHNLCEKYKLDYDMVSDLLEYQNVTDFTDNMIIYYGDVNCNIKSFTNINEIKDLVLDLLLEYQDASLKDITVFINGVERAIELDVKITKIDEWRNI